MKRHEWAPCEPGERPRNAAAGEPEAPAARLPESKRWTPSGCLVGGMGSATPARNGRRRRLTRAFRRLAVPLLGAALAMFLFGGGAHAQTSQVLVSNLGQTYQSASGFSVAGAQGFSTGTNAAGYTLTSVEIRLAANQVPTVTLHRGSPAGTKVADFTGPSSAARESFVDYTFTPTTTVTLDRNTNYWVVATDSAFGDLWAVAGPGEDATPAPGWSIRDRGQSYNPNIGGWQDHGADLANQLRLNGVIESDPTPPDTTAPTVAITTTAEEPVSGPFPITVAFSETVTGFALDDLVVGNGSASDLAGRGRSYTATVTPAASGTVTVDIPAGAAEDDANNPSTAAARLSVTADLTPPDTTPPTVEIATIAEEPVTGPFPITVTFSEAVAGFALDDLVVGNGNASDLAGRGATYTATVTPAASGEVTVDIPAGAAEDDAGNPSTAVTRLSVTADLTQTSQVLVSNLGQTYQSASGFSVAGAQGFSTGTNAAGYTLTSVEIRLAANQVPTVTLHRGSPAGTKVADFTGPSSAARESFVDYTFTPTTTVTLDRNTNYWVVATDSAFGDLWAVAGPGEDATPAPGWSIRDRGQSYNPNIGGWQDHGADLANQLRLNGVIESDPTPPDTTAPTVAITTTAEEPVSGPFPITVAFSETVTGFALDDLVVGNGSASDLAGRGRSYTATVTPAASGTVTVDIPAGAAEDDANNPSTAAARLSVTADLTTELTIVPGVTPVKAVHFMELRTRIDALRREAGLAPFAWTDPVLTAGVTPVKAAHLVELRGALGAAYAAAGRAAPPWTDAAPVAGTTPIRGAHVMELRAAVLALE